MPSTTIKKSTAKKSAPAKAAPAGAARRSRRVKCACASCVCTVDIEKGYRKGNLVFCGRLCATRCVINQCYCEHDHCHV